MNIPGSQQAVGMPMSHVAQAGQMSHAQQGIGPQGQQQAQQVQVHQEQQAQQAQQHQQQQQQQQKTDEELHIVVPKLYAKVKSLIGPLRESLTGLVKIAALALQQNALLDAGSSKSADPLDKRFNKSMEEFYSICDQIEYNLKTLIEIQTVSSNSQRCLPLPIITPRTEKAIGQKPALTYTQFLMTVRSQICYAKDVHDALMAASRSLALGDQ